MPNLEDLVTLLADIHITDRDRRRAYTVAGHLVASALKERWHGTSDHQRQIYIRDSGDRLWNSYGEKRRNENIKPKEAARDAIYDEMTVLDRLFNPKNAQKGQVE
jgi:hypothetical protein